MIRDNKGRFVKEGKVWIGSKGYSFIWINGKSKLFHEYVWETHNHCKKPKGFFIHHKDGNKQNNDIANLKLVTDSTHKRIHSFWIMNENQEFIAKLCSKCGKILPLNNFYNRNDYGRGYSTPSVRCKLCHNL